ncbi:MAG: zinc finger CCCH domain-containing protein, partial [bacterium]|nr:zinc finger CCCH domain-containing protein [bacterium]
KRIRYCIKFQTGECTFGDTCRFEHAMRPDAPDRSPPASPKAKTKPKAKGKAAPAPTPEEA